MARRPRSRIHSGPGLLKTGAMVTGILCVVLVIGGILSYGTWFYDRVDLDAETGCPVTGPISRKVVLIDQTDTFTPVQAKDIRNKFDAYKESVPRYGELVVYAIQSGSGGIPRPIARACNPGSAEDADQWVESAVRVARQWQSSFDEPLRAVMDEVLKPASSDNSPIIETIQAVVVSEFGQKQMDSRKKELIIISDFLQHSNALSHYAPHYNVDDFIDSQAFKKLRVDMKDVDVDLLYLYRNTQKAKQDKTHINFWRWLIQKQDGKVHLFYPVSG